MDTLVLVNPLGSLPRNNVDTSTDRARHDLNTIGLKAKFSQSKHSVDSAITQVFYICKTSHYDRLEKIELYGKSKEMTTFY